MSWNSRLLLILIAASLHPLLAVVEKSQKKQSDSIKDSCSVEIRTRPDSGQLSIRARHDCDFVIELFRFDVGVMGAKGEISMESLKPGQWVEKQISVPNFHELRLDNFIVIDREAQRRYPKISVDSKS